jgi:hypothetical protein
MTLKLLDCFDEKVELARKCSDDLFIGTAEAYNSYRFSAVMAKIKV